MDEVKGRVRDIMGIEDFEIFDPSWLVAFNVNKRMVPRYRMGRVFLAGDAAHIHSPAGGQGMNTGKHTQEKEKVNIVRITSVVISVRFSFSIWSYICWIIGGIYVFILSICHMFLLHPGLQDAFNLAFKMAACLKGEAGDGKNEIRCKIA